LIAATLFFNFGLCFINNKAMAVGEAHVVLAEAMIMAATWGVLLMSRRPLDLCWVCFAIAIVQRDPGDDPPRAGAAEDGARPDHHPHRRPPRHPVRPPRIGSSKR
jgi:hypothetical protein